MANRNNGAREARRAGGPMLEVICALFSLALCGEALADPTNYQRYIIGERAIGMGGAQTAAVNDPMANLYNPAAMVFTTSTMVSASKCVYSLDYRKIEGGYIPASSFADTENGIDAARLEHKNDLTLPSTLAITTRFGDRLPDRGPLRHAFGVAILVPNQDEFTFAPDTIKAGDGELEDRETYRLAESYKQVWMGVSYALRATREIGLGVSAFLVTSTYRRHMTFSRYGDEGDCGLVSCGFMEFKESDLSIDTVSLLFRVGGLWEPHRNWRFGLVVSAPTILLGDLKLYKTQGSLRQIHGTAWVTDSADDYADYVSAKYDLKVATREPLSIRAGTAFLWNDAFTVALDGAVHMPISYRRIQGHPVRDLHYPIGEEYADVIVNEDAPSEWYDNGVVKRIERETVANFNIGWELVIDDTWTIRNGLFTDFSAAPAITTRETPQLMHVDRYGIGLSGGFKAKGYDISIGFTGSLGYGMASVHNPHTSRWEPAPVEERAIYVFIAGIQSAAVKTSRRVVKKVKKAYEERDRREEEEAREVEEEAPREAQDEDVGGGGAEGGGAGGEGAAVEEAPPEA